MNYHDSDTLIIDINWA